MKDKGWAILRIGVGLVFVAHGLQKLLVFGIPGLAGFMTNLGIPLPTLSAVAVTSTELLAGAALLVGAGTRLAAIPLAFTMLVAGLSAHRTGFFLPDGFEFVFVLFLASLAFALGGPGAWAVDNLFVSKKEIKARQLMEVA